jgi:hypothetical protein
LALSQIKVAPPREQSYATTCDYDGAGDDDDEAGYRFGNHIFRPGEYVSIRGEDGEMHTFQVISVEPAT